MKPFQQWTDAERLQWRAKLGDEFRELESPLADLRSATIALEAYAGLKIERGKNGHEGMPPEYLYIIQEDLETLFFLIFEVGTRARNLQLEWYETVKGT